MQLAHQVAIHQMVQTHIIQQRVVDAQNAVFGVATHIDIKPQPQCFGTHAAFAALLDGLPARVTKWR